jgi:hypothetical protein
MAVSAGEDRGEYCRQVEAYLCRKNQGHLIRIVGPAFEVVCSWADRGVPLTIACQGIDRCVERHAAKIGRRRPVQIQFCEGDVLDLFDDWRRAIGVRETDSAFGSDTRATGDVTRHGSLPAHLDRVIARLTLLRGGTMVSDEAIDRLVRELDGMRGGAKGLRGSARDAALDRLRELDSALLASIREGTPERELHELRTQAERELEPFRERLPQDAYEQAAATCVDRLLRTRTRVPSVAFD